MRQHVATLLGLLAFAASSHAHYDLGRPDAHAPISVMADHYHGKGEVMLSYRYMFMNMDGMRSGTDDLSAADVFANNYTVTPVEMDMQMHMVGAMYAPSERLTLMAMLPYSLTEMEHEIFPGAASLIALNGGLNTFTTESDSVGDLKLTSMYGIVDQPENNLRIHASSGSACRRAR